TSHVIHTVAAACFQRTMHARITCLKTRRSHNPPAKRPTTNDDRLTFQFWIILLFNFCIKSIHNNMNNTPLHFYHHYYYIKKRTFVLNLNSHTTRYNSIRRNHYDYYWWWYYGHVNCLPLTTTYKYYCLRQTR